MHKRSILLALATVQLLTHGPAAAQEREIVLEVRQVSDVTGALDPDLPTIPPFPPFPRNRADLFVLARINGGPETQSTPVIGRDSAEINFTLSASVLETQRFHNVHLELWEADDASDLLTFDDPSNDVADANPIAGLDPIDAVFDACTLTWTVQGFGAGDLLDQGPGEIFYQGGGDTAPPGSVSMRIRTGDGQPFTPDDVAIVDSRPVQVTFGEDFAVVGKETVIRIDFANTFGTTQFGMVTVDVSAVTAGGTVLIASETRNVGVEAGGATRFFFDGSFGVGPFLAAGDELEWSVDADFPEIGDPGDPVFGDCWDLNNSSFNNRRKTVVIDDPTVLYAAWDWGNAPIFPDDATMLASFTSNERFRKATTPIVTTDSFVGAAPLVSPSPSIPEFEPFLSMSLVTPMVLAAGKDIVVLMPREGWFAANLANSTAFTPNQVGISYGEFMPHVVIAEANDSQVVVHEIGHTERLSRHPCTTGDIWEDLFELGCRDEALFFPGGPTDPFPAIGFDVGGNVYPMGFATPPTVPISRQVFATNIMGTVGQPPGTFNRWIDDLNYNSLLRTMQVPAATTEGLGTTVLTVTGSVEATTGINAIPPIFNGTLLTSYQLVSPVPPDFPEAPQGGQSGLGPFAVKLITPNGPRTYRFDPPIVASEDDEAADYGFFAFSVPWDDLTTRVELYGPVDLLDIPSNSDTLLWTVDRTAAIPAISNLRAGVGAAPPVPPAEPPLIGPGQTVGIGWDVTDPDSPVITSMVLLYDTSFNLLPVASDITGGEHVFPQAVVDALPPGQYGIRVVASDDINTAVADLVPAFEICKYTNGGVETCDGVDNDCDGIVDEDSDGDGICDGDDPCPLDNPDDSDGDGVCDSDDLCPGFDDTVDCNGNLVPDGCEPASIAQFTNFSVLSGPFLPVGTGVVTGGRGRLTQSIDWQTGSLVFFPVSAYPVDHFIASFDFQIGPRDSGIGADGLSFALLDESVHPATVLFGEDGPPGPGSLVVSFDTYFNGAPEPGDNFVEIRLNDAQVVAVDPGFDLEDGLEHHAEVILEAGPPRLTVIVTPNGGAPITVFDAVVLSNFVPFVSRYGFGGRTGAERNEHWVDNVDFTIPDCDSNGVLDLCDPDLDGDSVPDVCDFCPLGVPPEVNGITWYVDPLNPNSQFDFIAESCADTYNVYRLTAPRLTDSDDDGLADSYGVCLIPDLDDTAYDPSTPPLGEFHFYLVTGENAVGEGTMGFVAAGERPNLAPCP